MTKLIVLEVYLQNQLIGSLTRLPNDKNIFTFEPSYVDNPQRPTLSLSFKGKFGELITEIKATQTRLPAFFSNLLPEGPMRTYLAARAGVAAPREFFLLGVLGQNLPGAVKIQPANEISWPPETWLSTHDKSQSSRQDEVLRFSLAGVQFKFSAILRARGGLTIPADGLGGSWIVKLPSNHYQEVPKNEYAMLELARHIGIEVPKTQLISLKKITGLPKDLEWMGKQALAIKRFDRDQTGKSIHMEDFAQVFNVYPEKKYELANYRNIAQVIWLETGEVGLIEFIRRFIFNVLIGNGNMHLKNWSLLYPDTRVATLAPAYDYVSTINYLPHDRLALNFVDSKAFESITIDQMKRFAAKAQLPEKLVLDTAQATIQKFREVWRQSKELGVSPKIKKVINTHLKTLPLWRI